jgi:RNA polymerase sigma-70 factor (ECF subfamily)
MSDQDLLRSYVDSQDADLLGALLARYQDSLVRFVTRFIHDSSAAQDIVQETFLRVARRPTRLLGVASCHNWLLSVARNLSVDYLRRKVRLKRQAEALADRRAQEAAAVEPAESGIEREELRAQVRSEIFALPPRLRELVLLKVQEGKSYREIAQITGLSVTNVGYLLHQAMKTLAPRLRRILEC